jgi:hypothetical protein
MEYGTVFQNTEGTGCIDYWGTIIEVKRYVCPKCLYIDPTEITEEVK